MDLVYDPRDDAYHERLGSRILYWLDDLGALPFDEADPKTEGGREAVSVDNRGAWASRRKMPDSSEVKATDREAEMALRRGIDQVIEALQSEDEMTRARALQAFRAILLPEAPERVVQRLVHALDSDDQERHQGGLRHWSRSARRRSLLSPTAS